jgi:flagellar motor switch protein FliG
LSGVDNATLITALAGATVSPLKGSADFILSNMSSRMADQLRESIQERGTVSDEDGENAMSDVVANARELAQNGEILLIESEEA